MLLLGALLLGASAYQLPARPHLPTHATRAPAPLLFQPPTPIVRNSLNGTTATKAFAVLESEWQELPGAAVLRDRFLEKSTRLEVLNAVLVFLSFSITAIYTVDGLTPLIAESLRATENVIVLSFATEFTLRWWSQSLRPSYLFNPLVLLELASFLPFLVLLVASMMPGAADSIDPLSASALGGVFRSLRVFRLQRFVADPEAFRSFLIALGRDDTKLRPGELEITFQVARVVASILSLVFVATGLIYEAEKVANPQFSDFFTALYFGLTTLTTVGFGDITPVTFQGRLIVCLSILVGATIIPFQLAELGEALLAPKRDAAAAESETEIARRLRVLKDLLDQGLIDEERYNMKSEEILSEL